MEIKQLLLEFLIGAAFWGLEWLVQRLFGRPKQHSQAGWALLLMALTEANLGFYWFAYPMIGWMLLGIGLVVLQLTARREFLYQRYWPAFWRLSFLYASVVWAGSCFLMQLPTP